MKSWLACRGEPHLLQAINVWNYENFVKSQSSKFTPFLVQEVKGARSRYFRQFQH